MKLFRKTQPINIVVAFMLLIGCSNNSCAGVACPNVPISMNAKLYYVGSFVSGPQAPPVQFTGVGETATITLQEFKNNQPQPLAPVSGAASGTCTAATLQQLATPGEIQVKKLRWDQSLSASEQVLAFDPWYCGVVGQVRVRTNRQQMRGDK